MNQRQLSTIAIVVGLVLGAGVVVAATTFTPTSGTIFLTTNSGTSAGVSGGPDINMSQPFINDSAVDIETAAGNMTVVGGGTARVTVAKSDIEGTWTNLTALDVDQAEIKVAPADKPAINVSGDADTLDFRATTDADDGVADIAYSGASGTTTVTLRTAPANTELAAVDQNNKVLAVATSDGSGTVTFSGMANSAHTVRLATNAGAPTVDNASATPQGGKTIRWQNETLSIDVDDPDFPDDNVTVEFVLDGNSAGTTSLSAAGTASLSVDNLGEGSHTWSIKATDAYGATTTSETFSFTVDHYDPVVTDAYPQGNLQQAPGKLNVTVEDGDFGRDGDQLDVAFELDGSSVGSDTLNANGTASVSVSGLAGGPHTWNVTITDQYGQTTTQSYAFNVPNELRIYHEEDPDNLVDNVTADLEFYFPTGSQDQIVSRSTSDGTLNLTGLPADQPFVIVADAPGQIPRRIFVSSLYETQRIYLLNESSQDVDTIFQIQDYSGQFPQDTTVLEIQRSINGTWQTVEGDYFGANSEFPAQLSYNTRHQLILRNTETGATRNLGTYTPLTSEQQTVTVSPEGNVTIARPTAITSLNPSVGNLPARQSVGLNASIQPGVGSTFDTWNLTVYYVNGSTNTSLYQHNSTASDGGHVEPTLDLRNRAGGEVKVVYRWATDDGTDRQVITKGITASGGSSLTLIALLGQLAGLIAGPNQTVFQSVLALTLTIMGTAGLASSVRLPTELLGAVALLLLATFAVIGWLSYEIVFVGVVSWASLSFLRRRY